MRTNGEFLRQVQGLVSKLNLLPDQIGDLDDRCAGAIAVPAARGLLAAR